MTTYGNYPDLTSVKKILVIKLRHHGDVLLSSPVFTNLKKSLPEAQVDAFIYKDTLPMLEGHEAISDFFLYDRAWKKLSFFGKLKEELALFRKIRKNNYDLVINLTEGDRGALAALFSGAKLRVGIDPEKEWIFRKKTHLHSSCKKL
ncbi:MAG: glycosyltransferase family 9 protein [Rhabdochlamydiaceae bacterium]|jgi:heptosyltransferase-3